MAKSVRSVGDGAVELLRVQFQHHVALAHDRRRAARRAAPPATVHSSGRTAISWAVSRLEHAVQFERDLQQPLLDLLGGRRRLLRFLGFLRSSSFFAASPPFFAALSAFFAALSAFLAGAGFLLRRIRGSRGNHQGQRE